ncbi:MAG: hypothetical protein JNK05_17595 [Myxococcales bacterium]|nr:hypothetical protein [Myxococcales bacterium]
MNASSSPHEDAIDTRVLRSCALAASLTLLVAGSLAASHVEDWDGVGFALASQGVDLARFRPHPPGYPTYALVARSLGALGASLDAVTRALAMVSALGLAAFSAGVCAMLAADRTSPWWRRSLVAVLAALALPGTLRLATSVAPTSLALGLWALALGTARVRPDRWWLASLLLGASLASRPTDLVAIAGATLALWPARAPLAKTVALACTVGALAHGPLILSVGIRAFATLVQTHGAGHFDRVHASHDGSLVERLATVSGYLTERTSAPSIAIAIVSGVIALALVVRASSQRARVRVFVGVFICAAWWCVAQPARVERHLAWLGALGAIGLARVLLVDPSRALRTIALVVALVTTTIGVRTALDRQRVAPAPVQIGAFVRGRGGPLFGARHARAAEIAGVEVFVARYEGEVWSTLTRMQRLPSLVWVTDEVAPWPEGAREIHTFCGPRSSRGEPACVRVRALYPRAQ